MNLKTRLSRLKEVIRVQRPWLDCCWIGLLQKKLKKTFMLFIDPKLRVFNRKAKLFWLSSKTTKPKIKIIFRATVLSQKNNYQVSRWSLNPPTILTILQGWANHLFFIKNRNRCTLKDQKKWSAKWQHGHPKLKNLRKNRHSHGNNETFVAF